MSEATTRALRAHLCVETLQDFCRVFAPYLSRGGVFIPLGPEHLLDRGVALQFQFILNERLVAFAGEGVVEGSKKLSLSHDDPTGVLVRFTRLTPRSFKLVERITGLKEQGKLEATTLSFAHSDDSEAEDQPSLSNRETVQASSFQQLPTQELEAHDRMTVEHPVVSGSLFDIPGAEDEPVLPEDSLGFDFGGGGENPAALRDDPFGGGAGQISFSGPELGGFSGPKPLTTEVSGAFLLHKPAATQNNDSDAELDPAPGLGFGTDPAESTHDSLDLRFMFEGALGGAAQQPTENPPVPEAPVSQEDEEFFHLATSFAETDEHSAPTPLPPGVGPQHDGGTNILGSGALDDLFGSLGAGPVDAPEAAPFSAPSEPEPTPEPDPAPFAAPEPAAPAAADGAGGLDLGDLEALFGGDSFSGDAGDADASGDTFGGDFGGDFGGAVEDTPAASAQHDAPTPLPPSSAPAATFAPEQPAHDPFGSAPDQPAHDPFGGALDDLFGGGGLGSTPDADTPLPSGPLPDMQAPLLEDDSEASWGFASPDDVDDSFERNPTRDPGFMLEDVSEEDSFDREPTRNPVAPAVGPTSADLLNDWFGDDDDADLLDDNPTRNPEQHELPSAAIPPSTHTPNRPTSPTVPPRVPNRPSAFTPPPLQATSPGASSEEFQSLLGQSDDPLRGSGISLRGSVSGEISLTGSSPGADISLDEPSGELGDLLGDLDGEVNDPLKASLIPNADEARSLQPQASDPRKKFGMQHEEEEESLEALVQQSKKHLVEDPREDDDVLDALLGDAGQVAGTEPPAPTVPLPTQEKKKGGFLSSLFGRKND